MDDYVVGRFLDKGYEYEDIVEALKRCRDTDELEEFLQINHKSKSGFVGEKLKIRNNFGQDKDTENKKDEGRIEKKITSDMKSRAEKLSEVAFKNTEKNEFKSDTSLKKKYLLDSIISKQMSLSHTEPYSFTKLLEENTQLLRNISNKGIEVPMFAARQKAKIKNLNSNQLTEQMINEEQKYQTNQTTTILDKTIPEMKITESTACLPNELPILLQFITFKTESYKHSLSEPSFYKCIEKTSQTLLTDLNISK